MTIPAIAPPESPLSPPDAATFADDVGDEVGVVVLNVTDPVTVGSTTLAHRDSA